MTHLLDTNTCVSYLRGAEDSTVAQRLAAASPGSVGLCSVVKAELLYGAERSRHPDKNRAQLEQFFGLFPSFPFDDQAFADGRLGHEVRVLLANPISADLPNV